uniref:Protein Ycf2-like n=2 Tax=Cucumis melo TaxID=3656 RepID=A0A9I9DYQ9_CUCME
MVEGSGSKQDNLITSKKRGRIEPQKEDVTVQKKQRIKSLENTESKSEEEEQGEEDEQREEDEKVEEDNDEEVEE